MNVPDGWRTMTLDEVGTWFGGGTPSKSRPEFWDGGAVPWLSPKDMGEARLRGTRDKITDAAVRGSAVRMVPAGAVAFVVRSGILERALPSTLVGFPTTLNQDMKALVPHADIVTPEWLAHAFRAFEHPLLTGTRKAGTTVASLDFGKVKSFQLPVPPLPEQRRIVELVEEHMAHLDAADASLASAEQRAQDMLTAATNSALASSNGEEVTLEQLITSKLRNGRSVPTHPGGFPVLRLTCLTNGAEVDLTQSKEGAWDESEAEKFLVAEGDFLISRGNGSLNRVARGALVGKVERPVAIPDTIIQARPDVTKIDPNYLSIAWTSTKVRRQIQSRAKTTAGIYKVSQRDLSAVMVPVPHMDDQLAMVSQLQQLRGATTRLTEQLLAHKQRSAALRRAALAAAFAGQLKTSTDPSELRQDAALR